MANMELGDYADNVSALDRARRLATQGRYAEARAVLEELSVHLARTTDLKSQRLLGPVVATLLLDLDRRLAPRRGARRVRRPRGIASVTAALRDVRKVLGPLHPLLWQLTEILISILLAIDIVKHHID